MYLTYEAYLRLGGDLDNTAFNVIEKRAEIKLDYYTQNRLHKGYQDIEDTVQFLMYQIIEMLQNYENSGNRLSGYSNGIETFSFNNNVGPDDAIYDLIVEFLPVEYVSCAID